MDKKVLERYIEGNATPQEIEEVVTWLDTNEENVREFMALHKLYDISVMNQMNVAQPADNSFSSQKPEKRSLFWKVGFEAMKIAAIIAVVLGIKTVWQENNEAEYQTIYVPTGQRAELTLPDSTKVWLNSHTRLVYPLAFGKKTRQVKLDGEAYFSVKHDGEKPFIVETNQIDVRVLGTEFNIIAYSGYPEQQVSLLQGCVELEGKALASGYRMNPNQLASINNGKLTISNIKDYDYFKWKEGLICFNNEPVRDMIKKLELYYDIQIKVNNKRLLQERYSGKFRTKDGIEQVLTVLQVEHKFTYTRNNDLNLITIK